MLSCSASLNLTAHLSLPFEELQAVVGFPEYYEESARYSDGSKGEDP